MSKPARFIDAVDPRSPPPGLEGAVVAIGNFDGLHRGHRGVIERAKALAARLGKPCAVLTFEPHPADFFAKKSVIFRLTSHEAKAAFLARLGLDGMIVLTFDAALSGLTARQFVDDVLVSRLGVCGVVAGYDFHFGAKRQGTPEFLIAEGARLGFAVDIVERIAQDEKGSLEAVSSTATRAALQAGDVALAARLLGHAWFIEGKVVHGRKVGRAIGFPTANIELDPSCRLRHGIYAVTLTVDGKTCPAAANFGSRPTFDDGAPLLEVFVLDFDGDLYGKMVEVVFVDFIRAEAKFDSVEALVARMKIDVAETRKILAAWAGR
ncbi:MAG: bifunctional riboflavin kinase/FAD synthetase [Rhodoblastus sp.]